MKGVHSRVAAILICSFYAPSAVSQMLSSQAKGASRAQIVMLSVEGGCAGGIIVGYDEKTVYVATAAHVADLSAQSLPLVKVKFEGLIDSARTGRFWPQFETRDKGDLAVVTVDRDAVISKFLNGLDFAILSPVPLGPPDAPVTSIGCSGGGEWSSGSNETLLAPDQGYLRFQSSVAEGQSGGGLYNEAWELIGMPLDVGPNGIYARPIAQIVEDLRNWGVPVRIAPRPLNNRVRGADEVARENAAVAKSRELASSAVTIGSSAVDLGLLLAVEAIKIKDTPEARSSIFRLLAQTKSLGGLLGPSARGANCLAFAPDGKMLAVGLPGGVGIWNVATRRESQRLLVKGPAPESVALSHKGLVAAGTKDGTLIVWALDGATELRRVHVGQFVLAIAFDSDDSRVAAGDIEGKVVVVSIKDGSVVRLHAENPTNALWLDGQTLVFGGGQGSVTRWDLRKPDAPESSFIGTGQPYESAYDERITLFSGFTTGLTVPYINDAKSGKELHATDLSGGAIEIDNLAFSADGALLAGAAVAGPIAIWDTATGRRNLNDLIGHPGKVQALAFAPGGRLLAAGGPGGVTLFDLAGQSLVDTISVRGQVSIDEVPVMGRAGISAAFNSDGSMLAWPVGAAERKIVVWDFSVNKERARLHGDGVYAFSEDDRTLALESFDSEGTATVVELATGNLLRTEPAARWSKRAKGGIGVTTGQPWAVDNGHGLGASTALDGTLTLWETDRHLPLGTIVVPGAIEASYLVFDNAGRRLAVATSGGALSIVDVYLPSWINRACILAGRELDAAEWQRYIGKDRAQTLVCDTQRK
jgi:WD40 repeat protein